MVVRWCSWSSGMVVWWWPSSVCRVWRLLRGVIVGSVLVSRVGSESSRMSRVSVWPRWCSSMAIWWARTPPKDQPRRW